MMDRNDADQDVGQSLLVIHQGAMGDIVLTFPLLTMLQAIFDRVDLICQGPVGRLAVHVGVADAAFDTESAAFASLYDRPSLQMIRQLQNHDAVLLFSFSQSLEKTILEVGPDRVFRLLPRPAWDAPVLMSPWLLNQAKATGILPCDAPDKPPYFVRPRMEPNGEDRVVIHPGSGSQMKNWPLDRFLTVANLLSDAGRSVEFLAGPAEDGLMEPLAATGFPVRKFSELTELADWLMASAAFMGNDSGVSHLAGWLGVPTLAIFGPSNPKQWRPWGPAVSVVGPAPGFDCHPCFEKGNRKCHHRGCLMGIVLC